MDTAGHSSDDSRCLAGVRYVRAVAERRDGAGLSSARARAHRDHGRAALAAGGCDPQGETMTSLTEAQARAAIAPWYSLFNVASRGDVRAIQEQALPANYGSCAAHFPG